MAEFRLALRAFAELVSAFVAAGGVKTLVELWKQKIAESKAKARRAEMDALDRELGSGDPVRMERALVRMLDDTEHADDSRQGRGSVGGQGSGDGDGDTSPVAAGDETLARLLDR